MRDDYTHANDSFAEADGTAPTQEGSGPALALRLLRGRWHWAILLGVILAVGGGYLGYNVEGPEFEADTSIVINPNYGVAVDVKDLSLYEPYWNQVREEIDRLEDPATAELAMQQPDWQEAIALAGEDYASLTPEKFIGSLDLKPPHKNDRELKIAFISEEPLIAQAGLNAMLDAYRLLLKQGTNEDIDDNLALLQAQRRDLELRERQIKEQIRLVIPDNEYVTIQRQLAAKLGMLATMELDLSKLELVLEPFLNPNSEDAQLTIKDLMMQDPEMVALLEEKEALEDEYIYQTEVLKRGPTMRSVVMVKRMMSRVDRQILELEEDWIAQGTDSEIPLPDQVQDMMIRHKAMSGKIAELQAEVNDISTRLSTVAEDEYELEQTVAAIRGVQDQIDEFKATIGIINENEKVTRVEIGEKSLIPTAPANAKKRVQLAGMGGFAGMGVGFGLIMLVGLMDRRLRHVSDTATDLPDTNVLGILPTLPADLKDPEQADAAAHCVHHIRTLLQIGGTNRVFSITSPAAGSGKSSLATALGMSFAATGSRTLVIDSDLVGAGISRRMGSVVHESLDAVIRHKGMMNEADLAQAQTHATTRNEPLDEVLLQENLLDQEQIEVAKRLQLDTSLGLLDACTPDRLRACVASTGMDNFYVLPVGKGRPSDASRLSPSAMRELIRQAREAFDIVLVDTGPVLGSLEASIAAAESDATVMIVSRGDQRSIATRSLAQLRSVHAQIAGVVFNHALESDFSHSSYASLVSQERRPDMKTRKRKLDKTRSARLGPLGTAVASCATDEPASDDSLMVTPNGN